jgi:putative ABC transport system permease protein
MSTSGAPANGLAGIGQDIRYAARVLRRQPGYALLALLTLTLGIGATTALFSVTYGVLLRPLPWPDADRLVRLYETREGSTTVLPPLMTNSTYLAWTEHATLVDSVAAWSRDAFTLTGAGGPERVDAARVTPSLFDMMRVQPVLGTLFGPKDVAPGDTQIAVISYGLWQDRFGGRPDALGRVIQLDGKPHTVVAVMPREFAFPDRRARVWLPYYIPSATSVPNRSTIALFDAMARLKPGVTPAQVSAEATAAGRGVKDLGMVLMAIFGSKGPVKVTAVPALDAITGDVRPALVVLLAAVGLLLLTAAANVASLQLARATTRRREMAIRTALGAGTGRLTRQLLVENLLIGAAAGLCGLLLAFALQRALPALLPADFPRMDDVTVDAPVVLFAIVTALLSGALFGLMPALQARRLNLVATLADNGQAPAGFGARSRTARARMFIMAGQVGIACVLLLGASLLVRSFDALLRADRGYNPSHLLTAKIPLPDASYTGQRRAALIDALLARLRTLPDVRYAAHSNVLPLQNRDTLTAFTMPSRRGGAPEITVQARSRVVSADYFAAMGMRLADGRLFAETDAKGTLPVVVINRAFANKYLGPRPLGETLPMGFNDGMQRGWEVVGVIENVSYRSLTDTTQPEVYIPAPQLEKGVEASEPYIVLRTAGDPRAAIASLRALVREADPNVAIESIITMEDQLTTSLARPRLYAVLLGAFAAFALLIAGVGLFGVLSYSVAQRTREIGVRAALGARPRDIVRLVVRQGLLVTIGGVAAGLFAATLLVRFLATLLYGVSASDPTSFVIVPAAVLLVAAAACYLPARRASRVDPLRALRSN